LRLSRANLLNYKEIAVALGAPLATLAAPTGALTAITKRLAYLGMSQAQLFALTGLSVTDWNNLQTALGSANATALLKFLNASGLVLTVVEAPTPPVRDSNNLVVGTASLGAGWASSWGDLS